MTNPNTSVPSSSLRKIIVPDCLQFSRSPPNFIAPRPSSSILCPTEDSLNSPKMSDDQLEIAPTSSPTKSADKAVRHTPRSEDRKRSTSPRRDRDRHEGRPRRKDAGFKWKEKRREDDDGSRKDRESGLQRGYRDHYRPRSRSRSPPPRRHSPKREDRDRDRKRDRDEAKTRQERQEKRERKEKIPAPAVPAEPMIIVYVNDRLGTKQAIPCMATDSVSECDPTLFQRRLVLIG